ncbi:hypothetical protein Ocin01_13656 [Orchesella cincta]|uniref:Uncharacterized protein n=1 Tax=Orchesella cincta TaxID=48709 RepID=A0A1D2MJ22_ORCCI|nr:hypothetical protein Ocin01_13656 [Orchesella cincta]
MYGPFELVSHGFVYDLRRECEKQAKSFAILNKLTLKIPQIIMIEKPKNMGGVDGLFINEKW